MQILLVDDEIATIKSLNRTIPWDDLGFEVVHTAQSAAAALLIARQYSLAVVITDIRMPGMSGLELIDELHKIQPYAKCIVLSGYSDFQYMQDAIRLHADAFLLKPISDSNIIAAIVSARDNYTKRIAEIASIQQAQNMLEANMPHIRSRFLTQLLKGTQFAPSEMQSQLNELKLAQHSGCRLSLLVVRIDEPNTTYDDSDIVLKEYAISNIISDFLSSMYSVYSSHGHYNQSVFWIMSKTPDTLTDFSISAQDAIRATLSISVSMALSDWGTFPDDASALYNKAVNLLRYTTHADKGALVMTTIKDSLTASDNNTQALINLYRAPSLIKLIEAQEWELADKRIESVFDELQARLSTSYEHKLEVWYYMVALVLRVMHQSGLPSKCFESLNLIDAYASGSAFSIDDMRRWTHSALKIIQSVQHTQIDHLRMGIISHVQNYLLTHMHCDTSLQAIADMVHVHPVYLSRIYKLSTNETLSNYILRIKMEEAAKLLLSNPESKVYEIAQRVGYSSTAYFCKVFKKYYHLTPQDYRISHNIAE